MSRYVPHACVMFPTLCSPHNLSIGFFNLFGAIFNSSPICTIRVGHCVRVQLKEEEESMSVFVRLGTIHFIPLHYSYIPFLFL